MPTRVAIVADTHDRVDDKLKKLFRNASVLVHAGDVTDEATLAKLHKMLTGATVLAVRGNNDRAPLAEKLQAHATVDVQGVRILACHRAEDAARALAADAASGKARVVVVGHSHKPFAEIRDGRLWINPGGAGPKRFNLPRAAAMLEIHSVELLVRIHSLEDDRLPIIAEARLTCRP